MNWQMWWKWVLATTIGFDLSFAVSMGIVIYEILQFHSRDPFIALQTGGLAGATGSLLLGVAQWMVLERWIARAYRWITATTGSFALSCAIGAIVGSKTGSVYLGCQIGMILGIGTLGLAQGGVLGQGKRVAWFAATLVGIVSGVGVGLAIAFPAMEAIDHQLGGGSKDLMVIIIGGLLIGSTAGAVVFGAITGTVLIKLLKRNITF